MTKQIIMTLKPPKKMTLLMAGIGRMIIDWGDNVSKAYTFLDVDVEDEDFAWQQGWEGLYNKEIYKNYNFSHKYRPDESIITITITSENITRFCVERMGLISLDVSGNTALKELYCTHNILLSSLKVDENALLTVFDCSYNNLVSLDVGGNTTLEILNCSRNQLKNLDVSGNTTLEILDCSWNQLKNVDVSENCALLTLNCAKNQLSELDVGENTKLAYLNCYKNKLTCLDVGKNIALKELKCGYNRLQSLDVSKNILLKELWCQNNKLTSLDLSNNPVLTRGNCDKNQIGDIDIFTQELDRCTVKIGDLSIGDGIDHFKVGSTIKGWDVCIYVNEENDKLPSGINSVVFLRETFFLDESEEWFELNGKVVNIIADLVVYDQNRKTISKMTVDIKEAYDWADMIEREPSDPSRFRYNHDICLFVNLENIRLHPIPPWIP